MKRQDILNFSPIFSQLLDFLFAFEILTITIVNALIPRNYVQLMPGMFKANERCYKRKFGLYGLEALNHRSELKILWDTFRSQIAELWFPYDRRIAEDRTWFYLLRSSAITIAGSQAIAEVCFHMIADSSIRDRLRSHAFTHEQNVIEVSRFFQNY